MCIDGEWSQGAERYSIRGCSLILPFYGFTCIFRIIYVMSFILNHVLFLKTMGSHILLSILFCKKLLFLTSYSVKLWYFRKNVNV